MRIRTLAPFALALAIACGGAETDETAVAEGTQEYAAGGEGAVDAMAVATAITENWESHYNMGAGHSAMALSDMADDGVMWSGDGTMTFGKDAIAANMEATFEAGSSQISIDSDEAIHAGDFIVTRGTYSVTSEMDGHSMTNTGYWVSLAENVEGEWTLHGVVGNMNMTPEMMPPAPNNTIPENGAGAEIVAERLDYYITHFNAGHPDMVAATYTEDAVVMGSGEMMRTGRAAAEERLAEMTGSGAQIRNIDIWRARELDDEYVTAAGTYTLEGANGAVDGHFAALYKRVDGELLMHWLLTSNHTPAM